MKHARVISRMATPSQLDVASEFVDLLRNVLELVGDLVETLALFNIEPPQKGTG